MNKKSEPAFPKAGNEWSDMTWVPAPAQDGMTLRDYFAAKAMQAILGGPDYIQANRKLAEASYAVADAMLEAREQ